MALNDICPRCGAAITSTQTRCARCGLNLQSLRAAAAPPAPRQSPSHARARKGLITVPLLGAEAASLSQAEAGPAGSASLQVTTVKRGTRNNTAPGYLVLVIVFTVLFVATMASALNNSRNTDQPGIQLSTQTPMPQPVVTTAVSSPTLPTNTVVPPAASPTGSAVIATVPVAPLPTEQVTVTVVSTLSVPSPTVEDTAVPVAPTISPVGPVETKPVAPTAPPNPSATSATPAVTSTAGPPASVTPPSATATGQPASPDAEVTPSPTQVPTVQPTPLTVTDTVDFKEWTLTLGGMESRKQLPGSDPNVPYITEGNNGSFLILHLDAQNNSSTARSLAKIVDFVLRDDQSNDFAEMTNHGKLLENREFAKRLGSDYFDTVVAPGDTLHTILLYLLPGSAKPVQLTARLIVDANHVSEKEQVRFDLTGR